ncbi:MAG: MOSC domain-containing protein [Chloroflexi bacterium]|nr:MOSC domain-containing protein [Chloroflexota bacterium]
MSKVEALYISRERNAPMESLQAAQLIENFGLEGDRKAKRGSKRQVLIMPLEILDKLGIDRGDVRENITISGFPVMDLTSGQRLQIGQAVLETTIACAPCDKMDALRPGLQEEINGQRGMLFRVIQGGTVQIGDPIHLIDEA